MTDNLLDMNEIIFSYYQLKIVCRYIIKNYETRIINMLFTKENGEQKKNIMITIITIKLIILIMIIVIITKVILIVQSN